MNSSRCFFIIYMIVLMSCLLNIPLCRCATKKRPSDDEESKSGSQVSQLLFGTTEASVGSSFPNLGRRRSVSSMRLGGEMEGKGEKERRESYRLARIFLDRYPRRPTDLPIQNTEDLVKKLETAFGFLRERFGADNNEQIARIQNDITEGYEILKRRDEEDNEIILILNLIKILSQYLHRLCIGSPTIEEDPLKRKGGSQSPEQKGAEDGEKAFRKFTLDCFLEQGRSSVNRDQADHGLDIFLEYIYSFDLTFFKRKSGGNSGDEYDQYGRAFVQYESKLKNQFRDAIRGQTDLSYLFSTVDLPELDLDHLHRIIGTLQQTWKLRVKLGNIFSQFSSPVDMDEDQARGEESDSISPKDKGLLFLKEQTYALANLLITSQRAVIYMVGGLLTFLALKGAWEVSSLSWCTSPPPTNVLPIINGTVSPTPLLGSSTPTLTTLPSQINLQYLISPPTLNASQLKDQCLTGNCSLGLAYSSLGLVEIRINDILFSTMAPSDTMVIDETAFPWSNIQEVHLWDSFVQQACQLNARFLPTKLKARFLGISKFPKTDSSFDATSPFDNGIVSIFESCQKIDATYDATLSQLLLYLDSFHFFTLSTNLETELPSIVNSFFNKSYRAIEVIDQIIVSDAPPPVKDIGYKLLKENQWRSLSSDAINFIVQNNPVTLVVITPIGATADVLQFSSGNFIIAQIALADLQNKGASTLMASSGMALFKNNFRWPSLLDALYKLSKNSTLLDEPILDPFISMTAWFQLSELEDDTITGILTSKSFRILYLEGPHLETSLLIQSGPITIFSGKPPRTTDFKPVPSSGERFKQLLKVKAIPSLWTKLVQTLVEVENIPSGLAKIFYDILLPATNMGQLISACASTERIYGIIADIEVVDSVSWDTSYALVIKLNTFSLTLGNVSAAKSFFDTFTNETKKLQLIDRISPEDVRCDKGIVNQLRDYLSNVSYRSLSLQWKTYIVTSTIENFKCSLAFVQICSTYLTTVERVDLIIQKGKFTLFRASLADLQPSASQTMDDVMHRYDDSFTGIGSRTTDWQPLVNALLQMDGIASLSFDLKAFFVNKLGPLGWTNLPDPLKPNLLLDAPWSVDTSKMGHLMVKACTLDILDLDSTMSLTDKIESVSKLMGFLTQPQTDKLILMVVDSSTIDESLKSVFYPHVTLPLFVKLTDEELRKRILLHEKSNPAIVQDLAMFNLSRIIGSFDDVDLDTFFTKIKNLPSNITVGENLTRGNVNNLPTAVKLELLATCQYAKLITIPSFKELKSHCNSITLDLFTQMDGLNQMEHFLFSGVGSKDLYKPMSMNIIRSMITNFVALDRVDSCLMTVNISETLRTLSNGLGRDVFKSAKDPITKAGLCELAEKIQYTFSSHHQNIAEQVCLLLPSFFDFKDSLTTPDCVLSRDRRANVTMIQPVVTASKSSPVIANFSSFLDCDDPDLILSITQNQFKNVIEDSVFNETEFQTKMNKTRAMVSDYQYSEGANRMLNMLVIEKKFDQYGAHIYGHMNENQFIHQLDPNHRLNALNNAQWKIDTSSPGANGLNVIIHPKNLTGQSLVRLDNNRLLPSKIHGISATYVDDGLKSLVAMGNKWEELIKEINMDKSIQYKTKRNFLATIGNISLLDHSAVKEILAHEEINVQLLKIENDPIVLDIGGLFQYTSIVNAKNIADGDAGNDPILKIIKVEQTAKYDRLLLQLILLGRNMVPSMNKDIMKKLTKQLKETTIKSYLDPLLPYLELNAVWQSPELIIRNDPTQIMNKGLFPFKDLVDAYGVTVGRELWSSLISLSVDMSNHMRNITRDIILNEMDEIMFGSLIESKKKDILVYLAPTVSIIQAYHHLNAASFVNRLIIKVMNCKIFDGDMDTLLEEKAFEKYPIWKLINSADRWDSVAWSFLKLKDKSMTGQHKAFFYEHLKSIDWTGLPKEEKEIILKDAEITFKESPNPLNFTILADQLPIFTVNFDAKSVVSNSADFGLFMNLTNQFPNAKRRLLMKGLNELGPTSMNVFIPYVDYDLYTSLPRDSTRKRIIFLADRQNKILKYIGKKEFASVINMFDHTHEPDIELLTDHLKTSTFEIGTDNPDPQDFLTRYRFNETLDSFSQTHHPRKPLTESLAKWRYYLPSTNLTTFRSMSSKEQFDHFLDVTTEDDVYKWLKMSQLIYIGRYLRSAPVDLNILTSSMQYLHASLIKRSIHVGQDVPDSVEKLKKGPLEDYIKTLLASNSGSEAEIQFISQVTSNFITTLTHTSTFVPYVKRQLHTSPMTSSTASPPVCTCSCECPPPPPCPLGPSVKGKKVKRIPANGPSFLLMMMPLKCIVGIVVLAQGCSYLLFNIF